MIDDSKVTYSRERERGRGRERERERDGYREIGYV